jgi:hypothetical protein
MVRSERQQRRISWLTHQIRVGEEGLVDAIFGSARHPYTQAPHSTSPTTTSLRIVL